MAMASLQTLVQVSAQVGQVRSRLRKIATLAEYLRGLARADIPIAVAYLAGQVRQGRIGVGPAFVTQVSQTSPAATSSLTLAQVDAQLDAFAGLSGPGSAARRLEAMTSLFALADEQEQFFLARLLLGELRQGALVGVMLDAVAAAKGIAGDQLRRAAMYADSLSAVAEVALLEGADALQRFGLQLLSPVAPMLAQTAADPAAALALLAGEAVFDWKLDGARIQVHKQGDAVRIFTRSANEVTDSVPEIVELVRALPVDQVVLDGEAIALDAQGRPQPFQVTMRRFGRRIDVEAMRERLPLRAFFFDCLYAGSRVLVNEPLSERLAVMDALLPQATRIPRLLTSAVDQADDFLAQALQAGHEGVMAKALASVYEAGNRGASWLKIKHVHTLDLVVLAAEWGSGRRTGTLSNLHLGALDPATGDYVMLGKTFKGLTDALLEWQTRELLAREVRREPGVVFVRPELVVEIAFSDLQDSIRYPGGLALRLARVKRYRTDKRVGEADDMTAVRAIHAARGGALS